MKTIFRMFKPLIKKLLISQMKSQQDFIISFILNKIKLPLTGEQEEQVVTVLYDALEEVIINQVEKI